MAQTGTTKHIVVNLDAHRDVRTVMNHVVSEMVVRGYSEYEIWKVWAACRDAEDTDELCGWLSTFLPIRVRQTARDSLPRKPCCGEPTPQSAVHQ